MDAEMGRVEGVSSAAGHFVNACGEGTVTVETTRSATISDTKKDNLVLSFLSEV